MSNFNVVINISKKELLYDKHIGLLLVQLKQKSDNIGIVKTIKAWYVWILTLKKVLKGNN